jgi:hypothetical protein
MSSAPFHPPGLLAGPADFARVRDEISRPGLMRDLAAFIRRLADHELGEPVVTRTMEGYRLLHVSRLVLRRVINCGIAYQLDHDPRHARRAILDLQAAATFSDWNPAHFLDVGEMCCAFALGLDWLHDALSSEERTAIEDALIRLGLEAGMADPKAGFITATNNWNAVCNGGLAMGAIAVRHRKPELAEKLISRCIENLPIHGINYAPEGAFIEGSTYWAYGTLYHSLAIESLLRGTGSTHGLDTLPGFRESADYMTHVVGPTGEFYAYFDSRSVRIPLTALLWFGRHFDNPGATRGEAAALRQSLAGPLEPILWTENRCFALSLLWLKSEHLADTSPTPLAWSGDGPNPVAFWRTGWTRDSVWVGAKGGCARLSHGHLDGGSFVFEAGGVRWAVDAGMEEYPRLEALGVNLWGKDRWTLFRLGPEGHSIPRIHDALPNPEGKCPRLHWSPPPHPEVSFDLTALYPDTLRRLHRTISTTPEGETHWRDDVSGLAAGRTYRFTWVTQAGVTVDAAGVWLTQNGRRLRLEVQCKHPFSARVLDHTVLLKPFDTPMPDIKRVEFAIVSSGDDFSLQLTAKPVPVAA